MSESTHGPTPRDAAPAHERRKELVAAALAELSDIEELDVPTRLERLDAAQVVLARVLAKQPADQDGLPGLPQSR